MLEGFWRSFKEVTEVGISNFPVQDHMDVELFYVTWVDMGYTRGFDKGVMVRN